MDEKIQQFITNYENSRKAMIEEATSLFKEFTIAFFEKNPPIKSIIWTQYTPYFNDGDTCEFFVTEPYFSNDVNITEAYEGEDYDEESDSELWSHSTWSFITENKSYQAKIEGVDVESIKQFSSVLQSSVMEDVLQDLFGDHVTVVATRDGFDVNDYYHD